MLAYGGMKLYYFVVTKSNFFTKTIVPKINREGAGR